MYAPGEFASSLLNTTLSKPKYLDLDELRMRKSVGLLFVPHGLHAWHISWKGSKPQFENANNVSPTFHCLSFSLKTTRVCSISLKHILILAENLNSGLSFLILQM